MALLIGFSTTSADAQEPTALPEITLVDGATMEDAIHSLFLGGDLANPIATLARYEVSTIPLGTSTGGISHVFDPRLPGWRRAGIGPLFAQWALTNGKNRVVSGLNVLRMSFASLGGFDLKTGELLPFKNIEGRPDGVDHTSLTLHMSLVSVTPFASFGLTDRADVGVAMPWLSLEAYGTNRYLTSSGTELRTTALLPKSASGIGDIAIFGKYQLVQVRGARGGPGGIALMVEMRLPTGDTSSLLGLGRVRWLVSEVVSFTFRGLSPHASIGFEGWSGPVRTTNIGKELARGGYRYSVGAQSEIYPATTVSVDVVGSGIRNGGQLTYLHFPPERTGSVANDVLVSWTGHITKLDMSAALRWSPWPDILVTAGALISLRNNGLRAPLTPVIGVEWSPK